jgi:deoxyribonuclease-4
VPRHLPRLRRRRPARRGQRHTATVDRILEIAGPGRLRLVHLNDSQDPRGSMRDRHERLGAGRIGLGVVEELLRHPATDGVPFILETPGSRDPGSDQIALVKRMRA